MCTMPLAFVYQDAFRSRFQNGHGLIMTEACDSRSRRSTVHRYPRVVAQNLILLVVGLGGLTLAADRFVVGAARVAARLQVSTVVTGALIVGFGTSAPELVVSTWATLTEGAEGTALAIGNIVGSNVANLTLVLALPALVYGQIAIGVGVKRQAALSAAGVTVFAAAVHLFEPTIWLGVTLGLLTLVALQMVVRINELFGGVQPPPPDTTEGPGPWIWTVVGLVGTMAFTVLAVDSATSIAEDLGWTGGFVGFALWRRERRYPSSSPPWPPSVVANRGWSSATCSARISSTASPSDPPSSLPTVEPRSAIRPACPVRRWS